MSSMSKHQACLKYATSVMHTQYHQQGKEDFASEYLPAKKEFGSEQQKKDSKSRKKYLLKKPIH